MKYQQQNRNQHRIQDRLIDQKINREPSRDNTENRTTQLIQVKIINKYWNTSKGYIENKITQLGKK